MSCSSCGSNSLTSCGCSDNCPNKTSDIAVFDGNLNHINVPAGASLNDVLHLLEAQIFTSIGDLDLQYVLAGSNCLGLAAGTYGYNQILDAIIAQLCALISNTTNPTDTDNVELVNIVLPDCFSTFTGITSTDLFNAILEEICHQASKAPTLIDYNSTDEQKLAPIFILKDIMSGLVDNTSYVYEHTTVITSPSLLNITIQPMKAIINSYPVYRSTSEVFPLTPNKDIYFTIDDEGVIAKIEQNIGDPVPSFVGVHRLYDIETDGSGVVSYLERFETSPFVAPTFTIANDSILTAMIADDQVTSAKLADVVVGGTVGDPSIVEITYNNKGQVTGTMSNMVLSGLGNGDILAYDSSSGGFVNTTPLNTGAIGSIPISIGGDFSESSIVENVNFVIIEKKTEINASTPEAVAQSALNVVGGTFMVPRYTASAASILSMLDGTLIYLTDTNMTFTSEGFWGVENGAWVKL